MIDIKNFTYRGVGKLRPGMENWNQDHPERCSNFWGLYIKLQGCGKWPWTWWGRWKSQGHRTRRPGHGKWRKACIIIIIKKGWECKARRGRLTPYQSEDPSPTLPTYRGKEEKGEIVEDKKGESNYTNKKALDLLLKPTNPTPSNTGSTISFQRDTERGIKVLRFCEVLQRGGAKVYRCAIKAPRVTWTGT